MEIFREKHKAPTNYLNRVIKIDVIMEDIEFTVLITTAFNNNLLKPGHTVLEHV